MMPISEYDAIITNFGDTEFTAYYKKGLNIKLSDSTTVITIYKPGNLKVSETSKENLYYKDAMIEISGNSTNLFNYKDFIKLQNAVEQAIDYLNKENENLIDRENCSYDVIKREPPEKKKTQAIKYADLEIGGIYKDNKEKEWIFLGEADLYNNNRNGNRVDSRYIYMPNIDGLELVDLNWFYSRNSLNCKIDSFASKKRFFEKVGQLEINSKLPITFFDDYSFFAVYGSNIMKAENEEKIRNMILKRKQKEQEKKDFINIKQKEIILKILQSTSKIKLSFEYLDSNEVKCTISINEVVEDEFVVETNYMFYENLFNPLISTCILKNSDNLDSIVKESRQIDDNINYIIASNTIEILIKNINDHLKDSISNNIDFYISQYKNNKENVEGKII